MMTKEQREHLQKSRLTHGLSRTKAYSYYLNIRSKYKAVFDDRWLDYQNFLSDMGAKKEGKYLVRHDKNQGFSKENCYWGDYKEDAVVLSYQGKLKTQAQWAKYFKVSSAAIYSAVKRYGSLDKWWEA